MWEKGQVSLQGLHQATITRLIRRGYLYIDNNYLKFPSPVHEMAFFMDRHQGTREKMYLNDFKDFLVEVVHRMNPEILRNSLSKDTQGYLLERHWQMKFYRYEPIKFKTSWTLLIITNNRTATSILPPNNFVSPDLPPH